MSAAELPRSARGRRRVLPDADEPLLLGAAALPWGRDMYPALIAKADVIGFDLYPLQEWCRPNRMADVFYSQTRAGQAVRRQADVPVDRGGRLEVPGRRDRVTPAVVRAESWMAIAGGAHGLGFWPSSWPAANARAIAAVGKDVARLGPVIYAPDAGRERQQPAGRHLGSYLGRRDLRDRRQLAATRAPTRRSRFPALNGRTLSVMGESRRVDADGDSFSRPLRSARRAHLHRGSAGA